MAVGDLGFREFGTRVVSERLDRMLSYTRAVRRGTDPEAVHDMRVASRRLRAALAVFGSVFDHHEFPRFLREVRSVTRSLGIARDLDVIIETLEGLGPLLPVSQRGGIQALIDDRRTERRMVHSSVRQAVDRVEHQDLPQWFAEIAAWPSVGAPIAIGPDGTAGPTRRPVEDTVEHNASVLVAERVSDLLSWERYIGEQHNVVELHNMRIACKHLRYTLEIFADLGGDEMALAIESIKGAQELLGSIHDADVLVPVLARQARSELKSISTKGEVLGVYGADFDNLLGLTASCRRKRDERRALYREFVVSWRRLRSDGVVERLAGLVRTSRRTARPRKKKGNDLVAN